MNFQYLQNNAHKLLGHQNPLDSIFPLARFPFTLGLFVPVGLALRFETYSESKDQPTGRQMARDDVEWTATVLLRDAGR